MVVKPKAFFVMVLIIYVPFIQLKQRAEAGDKKAGLAREFGISRDTVYQYLRSAQ